MNTIENPLQSWANDIFNESINYIREGTGINPFYCPELVPILIKKTKLLPLWSGIMIPIFNYGEEFSSSAAVESSFKKLKTVTMKHIHLPTTIEIFLENHITSLKGSSLRISTTQNVTSSISPVHDVIDSEISEDDDTKFVDVNENLENCGKSSDDSANSDQLLVGEKLINSIMNVELSVVVLDPPLR